MYIYIYSRLNYIIPTVNKVVFEIVDASNNGVYGLFEFDFIVYGVEPKREFVLDTIEDVLNRPIPRTVWRSTYHSMSHRGNKMPDQVMLV